MKRVVITLILRCRDDIRADVIDWMAANLAEHASHEFSDDYEPEFNTPPYEGPPLVGFVTDIVGEVVTTED
jgi:hypothetical protein